MAILTTTDLVWGVAIPKPLKGFPEGKVKLRLRNDSWALAYVKTDDGIMSYRIKERDGYWIPGHMQGSNKRI